MTLRNTSLYSQQPNGQTYADKLDPDFTVRIKTVSNPKALNGVNTTNYATEIIINDNSDITVNGVSAKDALSVRLRVSGATESQVRLKQILAALISTIPDWNTEDVWLGFPPVTLPKNEV